MKLNAQELIEMYSILSSFENAKKDVVLNNKFHISIDKLHSADMISLVESSKSGIERDIMRLISIHNPAYNSNSSTISNETFMYSPDTDSTIVSLSNQSIDTFKFGYTSTDNTEEVEFQYNTISSHGNIITFMSYLWTIKSNYIVYSSNYAQDCMMESFKLLKAYNENNS